MSEQEQKESSVLFALKEFFPAGHACRQEYWGIVPTDDQSAVIFNQGLKQFLN